MNAVEVVVHMKVGDRFSLHGHNWTISDLRGATIGQGYIEQYVWNDKHKEVKIKIKENDRLEKIP
jgi:hypothetical protein